MGFWRYPSDDTGYGPPLMYPVLVLMFAMLPLIGWRVVRRHPLTGELKPSLRHAPGARTLATLGRLSGRRWPIETCGADGKPSLGMGDEAGRGWRGWPHPLPLCMLAHFLPVRGGLR